MHIRPFDIVKVRGACVKPKSLVKMSVYILVVGAQYITVSMRFISLSLPLDTRLAMVCFITQYMLVKNETFITIFISREVLRIDPDYFHAFLAWFPIMLSLIFLRRSCGEFSFFFQLDNRAFILRFF